MSRRSRWFGAAVVGAGGFVLPGWPAGHAADLLVGIDGIALRARGRTVRLPWDAYRPRRASAWSDPGGARPECDDDSGEGWWVDAYARTRTGRVGVAVAACGTAATTLEPVRVATRTGRNRFLLVGAHSFGVPLWATANTYRRERLAEAATLDALCGLLSARPGTRAALARPEVVASLVGDLAAHAQGPVPRRYVAAPDTIAAMQSLDRLGRRHALGGRPLPGDDLPDLATLTDEVVAEMTRNHRGAGHATRPARLADRLRRAYLAVEPWPFGALTDPSGVASPRGPAEPS